MEIQIFIKTVDNQKFPFLVNTHITVLELKQRLHRLPVGLVPDAEQLDLLQADGACERFQYEIGINHRGIRLIFQGYPMSDDKILSSFNGLKDNSVIHLIRQIM